MGLQWVVLTYAVAVEVALAFLLTLPVPRTLAAAVLKLASTLLLPAASIVPFAAFQLLDIHWKNEHRLMCKSDEVCTVAERDRYQKSIFKAQRNAVLCVCAVLLYWCMYRICKYKKDIMEMEEEEKFRKNL